MLYITSVLITLLSNIITNNIINNKIENMGYMMKSKRTTKTSFWISVSLNFVPYLNILITILSDILCCVSLFNEKFLLELTKDRRHSVNEVIDEYKRNSIKKDVIKEALILDGADDKIIKEEFNKMNSYVNFASKEKWCGKYYYSDEDPIYNEKDYNKARAIKLAKDLLVDIEYNTILSNKQKQKILGLYKKEFLKLLNGKETKTDSTNKILKLLNN